MKGLRRTNRRLQESPGGVKDSRGNRVPKENICMTHGHGQRCGDWLREWGVGEGG